MWENDTQEPSTMKAVITVPFTMRPSFSPNDNTEGCVQIKKEENQERDGSVTQNESSEHPKAGNKEESQDDG